MLANDETAWAALDMQSERYPPFDAEFLELVVSSSGTDPEVFDSTPLGSFDSIWTLGGCSETADMFWW